MPRLFLGNLGHDCRQRDIERLFEGFGELRNINLKGQYGFIEVESKEDASDAVRKVNGQNFNGGRIRVELANACSDSDPRDSGSRARVSDGRYRRTNYRIIVRNLSSRTSWQDLKDYMKKAGEITYSTVNRENSGEGLIEFADRSSMEYAMDELDNTKLDGRRIELEEERRSRSRSRSRNRNARSRSRSSRRYERSRSRSRSKSRSRRERRREERSRSKSSERRRRQRSKSSSNSD